MRATLFCHCFVFAGVISAFHCMTHIKKCFLTELVEILYCEFAEKSFAALLLVIAERVKNDVTPYRPSFHCSYWVLTKLKLLNFCSCSLFVTPLRVNGTSCRMEETWTCCIWSHSAWDTALMCSVCIGTLKRGCSALHIVPFHKKTAGYVCPRALFCRTSKVLCLCFFLLSCFEADQASTTPTIKTKPALNINKIINHKINNINIKELCF